MSECYHETMNNNEKLQLPQIALGVHSLDRLPDFLRQYGTKVLLVHGHRPVEDGLLVKVRTLLEKEHFPCANLGQILPNPTWSSVKRGIHTARKEKCDIILSLGGGSTLQCAKAIALGAPYKGDAWDFWKGKAEPKTALALGSILTNPASRTELSEACTIVRKGKQKTYRSPMLVCDFAVMDPTLSQYPLYPTMNQIFGIFEHLFFAWMEKTGEQRQTAADLMKRLFACSDALQKDISSLPARTELYQIGLEMGEKISHVSVGIEDLADALAFACSLPEGSAGSALFMAWCDQFTEQQKTEAGMLGMEVFGLDAPDYDKTMEALCAEFARMNMPLSIPDAGLVISDKKLMKIVSSSLDQKVLKKANQKSTGEKCLTPEPEKKPSKPETKQPEMEPAESPVKPVLAGVNNLTPAEDKAHVQVPVKKEDDLARPKSGAAKPSKKHHGKHHGKNHAHKNHAHLKNKAAKRSKTIAARQSTPDRTLKASASRD